MMKSFFIFSLKVIVSFVLIAGYLLYFSNRYFLNFLNGKYLTVIDSRHSLFVVDGLYFGVSIPKEVTQIGDGSVITNLGIDIYSSNKAECDFYIYANHSINNTATRICSIDNRLIDDELKAYMPSREELAGGSMAYYKGRGKIIEKHIYQQTLSNESYGISVEYGFGGGTEITHVNKHTFESIRTPLQPLYRILLTILFTVSTIRLLTQKPILNNKQPLKEKIKIVFDFGIGVLGESIIVGVINIFLLIAVFIIKMSWI